MKKNQFRNRLERVLLDLIIRITLFLMVKSSNPEICLPLSPGVYTCIGKAHEIKSVKILVRRDFFLKRTVSTCKLSITCCTCSHIFPVVLSAPVLGLHICLKPCKNL